MKISNLSRSLLFIIAFASITLFSCKSKPKDADIQAAVTTKLSANTLTASISSTVNEGVVTLSGECSDDNCKAAAEESAKSVEGVKQVINHISIAPVPITAPVEISADEPLRTAVNETVKAYKGVTATIDNGIITLEGNIKRDELQKLMMRLNSLKPRKVENHLVIIK